jgi:hypothetical protein
MHISKKNKTKLLRNRTSSFKLIILSAIAKIKLTITNEHIINNFLSSYEKKAYLFAYLIDVIIAIKLAIRLATAAPVMPK